MFEYKCPHCGWVLKSPEKFTTKKPCLNCDGFIELQAAQPHVQLTAFGVGMLAFFAGFGICWLVFVR